MLGFQLSSKPGIHAHIEKLSKQVRRRFWVLYHLKKAGFTNSELAKCYRTCIRPVIDYCSVVYHSLLTDQMDQVVEGLQASALRCIYGYEVPYSRMRVLAEVTTLRHRRFEACDKFAAKCLTSRRFQEWFPLRVSGRAGAWGGEKFMEEFARCDRLRNSPIFYMRRSSNGKDGRSYGERNKRYRNEGESVSQEMNAARRRTADR